MPTDIPIVKESEAKYAKLQLRISTHHKEPKKFGNTSPTLPKRLHEQRPSERSQRAGEPNRSCNEWAQAFSSVSTHALGLVSQRMFWSFHVMHSRAILNVHLFNTTA